MAQTSLIPTSAAAQAPADAPKRPGWIRPFTTETAKAAAAAKLADDAQWRRLRQLQLIDLKAKGWTHEQMAEHFGVGAKTIKRDFVTIRKEGLIDKYESRIVAQLVPEAVRVFAEEMQNPTSKHRVKAASKVFDMLAKLGERKEERDKAAAANGSAEETLDSWYQQWQQHQQPPSPPKDAIDTDLAAAASNHSEQVFHGRADPPHTINTAFAPVDSYAGTNGDAPAGETGPDASSPGGLADAGGEGSAQTASPTSPDASEAGSSADPTVEAPLTE